jgi:hypothetical protein
MSIFCVIPPPKEPEKNEAQSDTPTTTLLLFAVLKFQLRPENTLLYSSTMRVGLGRVVRKVRQHPDDHEFESQRWQ